jgi:hypothetical protein
MLFELCSKNVELIWQKRGDIREHYPLASFFNINRVTVYTHPVEVLKPHSLTAPLLRAKNFQGCGNSSHVEEFVVTSLSCAIDCVSTTLRVRNFYTVRINSSHIEGSELTFLSGLTPLRQWKITDFPWLLFLLRKSDRVSCQIYTKFGNHLRRQSSVREDLNSSST